MIDNIFVINTQEQIKAIGTQVKFRILNELILNPATCQQLSTIFNLSKQKVHYNLKSLLDLGLIQIVDIAQGNKEVYYRAKAKNYVIDFSLGTDDANRMKLHNRQIIEKILESDHNIDLSKIARNLLKNSLKLKSHEKLMIVSGEYNMPLVKKIIAEAASMQIAVTLLYRDLQMLRAKHNEFSLAAFKWDYDRFNQLLTEHNAYMYLNGEARYLKLDDPDKIRIQQQAFEKSREILKSKKIKIIMMEGLINYGLSEKNLLLEINFWRSLDIDYSKLAHDTDEKMMKYKDAHTLLIENDEGTHLSFDVQSILCDYGSFTDLPHQSSTINIPGGEILFIPASHTIRGTVKTSTGYISGEILNNPTIKVKDGEVVEYSSDTNCKLISQCIDNSGAYGRKVSFISLGTNFNMKKINIDPTYITKAQGIITIGWGLSDGSDGSAVNCQMPIKNAHISIIS